MIDDHAETGDIEAALAAIGEGLDRYLTFEHSDAYAARDRWLTHLQQPLPVAGEGLQAVIDDLNHWVIPHGSPVPRPGFTSYITTGATTASLLATVAANIASPQRYLITSFNYLEELSLEWLAEMHQIGHLQGLYSSGGSVANLIALGGARQSAFEAVGHDPAAEGVNRACAIYASSECHHTIQRSAGVLGLGRRCVRSIPCNAVGQMEVEALQAAIALDRQNGVLPVAIVANAGTTNTGAIDPILAMGEIARQENIWFHVDGAYGLPGILDERLQPRYAGLKLADSVITDPHKWLGASVGIAATFVRDRNILMRAFTQEPADYLEGSIDQSSEPQASLEHSLDDFGIPYFEYGVELSAPCRGVVVWAMLKEIGVEGMRERIVRHNDMARHVAERAREHENLELLLEPELSICCFRYRTDRVSDLDRLNQRLHRRLVRGNVHMPSTTRVAGKLAIRPCFVGARTTLREADGLVDAVLELGRELSEEMAAD